MIEPLVIPTLPNLWWHESVMNISIYDIMNHLLSRFEFNVSQGVNAFGYNENLNLIGELKTSSV